jgi:uncharacterized protein YbjT (DUF2867 family)
LSASRQVFITGGTGYLGRPLIAALLSRGHQVCALVRSGSESKLPGKTRAVSGNALEAESFAADIPPADTLVHLVGTPKPSPAKAAQFRQVDLRSIEASVQAALSADVKHFVYLSVAQPAPVMRAYVEVRQAGEALLRASGLAATLVRPWYVLGPGHRWPYLLLPFYRLLETMPATRDSAVRLGLVTLPRMIAALVHAVENPPAGVRVVDVAQIRRF